jgi:hypothetical protein
LRTAANQFFFVFFYPHTGRIGLPVTPRLFMLNLMEEVADWYTGLTAEIEAA